MAEDDTILRLRRQLEKREFTSAAKAMIKFLNCGGLDKEQQENEWKKYELEIEACRLLVAKNEAVKEMRRREEEEQKIERKEMEARIIQIDAEIKQLTRDLQVSKLRKDYRIKCDLKSKQVRVYQSREHSATKIENLKNSIQTAEQALITQTTLLEQRKEVLKDLIQTIRNTHTSFTTVEDSVDTGLKEDEEDDNPNNANAPGAS